MRFKRRLDRRSYNTQPGFMKLGERTTRKARQSSYLVVACRVLPVSRRIHLQRLYRMRFKIGCLMLTLAIVGSSVFAYQTRTSQSAQPPAIAEVIRRFADAETQNKIARQNYAFTQDFDLITLGLGGAATGRFHRVSDIVLDDRGNRVEKITFFPPSTLSELQITNEDMQDLAGVQPFALSTEDLIK